MPDIAIKQITQLPEGNTEENIDDLGLGHEKLLRVRTEGKQTETEGDDITKHWRECGGIGMLTHCGENQNNAALWKTTFLAHNPSVLSVCLNKLSLTFQMNPCTQTWPLCA